MFHTLTICIHDRSSGYTDTKSWKLFQSPQAENDKVAKFEATRQQALDMLKEIQPTALSYSPFINKYAYMDNLPFEEHPQEANSIINQIYLLSKSIWELYNRILPLPPITDILLQYSAAFIDFYDSLLKHSIIEGENNTTIYTPTEQTYEAFVTYLVILKNNISELSSIQ